MHCTSPETTISAVPLFPGEATTIGRPSFSLAAPSPPAPEPVRSKSAIADRNRIDNDRNMPGAAGSYRSTSTRAKVVTLRATNSAVSGDAGGPRIRRLHEPLQPAEAQILSFFGDLCCLDLCLSGKPNLAGRQGKKERKKETA